jgi:phage repressor protein C with HTH and peptisase S24 domain
MIDELDVRKATRSDKIMDADGKIGEWQVPRELVTLATNSPIGGMIIFKIVGDTMAPTFNPTERVMIDTTDTRPTPGGVFLVWNGNGFGVKRVQYVPHSEPPRVRITADNPKYVSYECLLGEARIQGRVVGKWLFT